MSTTTTTTQVQQPEGIFRSTFDTTSEGIQASSIDIPRGPVKTKLTFYSPPADGSTPHNYVEPQPSGIQRNYGEEEREVTITDIRGNESSYNVNSHGFGVVQNVSSAEKDFSSDSSIKENYYPEVEQLILDHIPTAKRVLLFDHTIRRSGPNAHRAPVNRAHVDQTKYSAELRVRYHLPDEADTLLAGRVRIINVWRPLNGPVVASPLAFAASDSVPDEAVVPVEHRYPHRTGQTAGVKYTEAAKWHYWSGMTNDERLFLQCFDSVDGARTPHSAFTDPRTLPGWPGRESIEVRALVFG